MPIEGLSDRLRFPRIAKIRLGVKATNEKGVEYPKAVDYFVCDHPEFVKVYGEQPKTLDICFPTEDPNQFASQFYRAYAQTRGLICRGDGKTCHRMIDTATGETALVDSKAKKTEWVDVDCAGEGCEYYQSNRCRGIMFLQFLLPKVPGLGVWQLDTGSINSIININSGIQLLKQVAGKVAMIPLKLSVVPLEVSPGGQKKTVHVLRLELPFVLAELQNYNMLPEADDEIPEELFLTEEEQAALEEVESTKARPTDNGIIQRTNQFKSAAAVYWEDKSGSELAVAAGEWLKEQYGEVWAQLTKEQQEEAIQKLSDGI